VRLSAFGFRLATMASPKSLALLKSLEQDPRHKAMLRQLRPI
jgi:hypothetical protein